MEIFAGISIDPNVRFGKPCLKGTRVDVATVLDNLAAGESFETVQEEYGLTREQILDALRYAAHIAHHIPPAVANVPYDWEEEDEETEMAAWRALSAKVNRQVWDNPIDAADWDDWQPLKRPKRRAKARRAK